MKKRKEIAVRVVLLAVIITLAVAPALIFVSTPAVASNLLANGDMSSGTTGGNATDWSSSCTSGVSSGAYWEHAPAWNSSLFGRSGYYVHNQYYCEAFTSGNYKIWQPNVFLSTGVYSYTISPGCDGGTTDHRCYFDTDLKDDTATVVDGSTLYGYSTISEWDVGTSEEFSITVSGNYTLSVTLGWTNGTSSAMFSGADLERLRDLAGPTPVPTASPLPPQATACVNATALPSSTPQATPTVFNLTPQPTGTRSPTQTPGGATATPGPAGTPRPQFDSGVAKFDTSLSPWTVIVDAHYLGIYTTTWQSDNGPDNLPGIAYLRDYIGWLEPTPDVFTYTAPLTGSLVYGRSQGFDFPLRIVGQAKWAEATLQGEKPYIRIWYFDPDYESVGHGAWVMVPADWIAVDGSAWRSIGYTLTQHGGSGRITAVAISEEIVDVVNVNHLGVMLDNLRIFSGPLAVAGSLPVCAGSGGSGRTPIALKQCKISSIVVDVYAGCTAPTDTLDLVGWVGYYFCRLWRYFSFNSSNRQQITDIGTRQNNNEPIGTINEMNDSFGVLYDTLASISSVYNSNDYYTIDWSMLTAPWSFDLSHITDGWNASPTPIDQAEVVRACPAYIANMNAEIQKSACFVIWIIKVKMRFWIFFQYALDVSAIIWALMAINEWVGKHG